MKSLKRTIKFPSILRRGKLHRYHFWRGGGEKMLRPQEQQILNTTDGADGLIRQNKTIKKNYKIVEDAFLSPDSGGSD
jgi:hypothetical protein